MVKQFTVHKNPRQPIMSNIPEIYSYIITEIHFKQISRGLKTLDKTGDTLCKFKICKCAVFDSKAYVRKHFF